MKGAILFLSCLALISAPPSGAREDVDPVGTWDVTIETPMGVRTSTMVIRREGEALAGVMRSAQNETAIDRLTYGGDEISFEVTIQFQGAPFLITYKGKVEQDSMKGEADFGGLASGEWSAVRKTESEETPPAGRVKSDPGRS